MQPDPEFHYRFRDAGKSSGAATDCVDLVGTYHRLLCEAVTRSCSELQTPWLLQSGGKDSTTLAIAIAETRPETTCITYLGGPEENELDSARVRRAETRFASRAPGVRSLAGLRPLRRTRRSNDHVDGRLRPVVVCGSRDGNRGQRR